MDDSPSAWAHDPFPPTQEPPYSVAEPAPSTSSRTSRSSAPIAAPGLGFVDGVLRTAFRFARSISVLIILVCALVLLGSGIGALYAIAPQQSPDLVFPEPIPESEVDPVDPESVPFPSARAYIAICTAPSPTTRVERVVAEPDPCAPFGDFISIVIKELQLSENARQPLCKATLDFEAKYRDPFSRGFVEFSRDFARSRPSDVDCNGVDAANFFIREFKLDVEQLEKDQRTRSQERLERMSAAMEARNDQVELAQIALARRQALFFPSILAAGASIAALLIFLVLPLLIQIERNTGAQLAAG